jgi:WD40 repeat protein/DNA-binding SARP family transcriptional activator
MRQRVDSRLMGIGVLGPVQVEEGTVRLGVRDRTVVAALAVRSGEVLSPEELAEAVWGHEPPATWNKSLQGCISRLRKHLGAKAIQTSDRGYRLALPADSVDAWMFEDLLGRAQEQLTLGEPERARFTSTQALKLWRGRPLVELEEWEPGAREVGRLVELRLDAEEVRLDAALQAGHHREVLAEAKVMVDAAPLRERRWTLLALAQYQSGRQSEALRTLHTLRTVLLTELGLDPGPDVARLEQAILQQDPALAVDAAWPESALTCPYVGLTPYGEHDAEAFFGRDDEVAAGLRRLDEVGCLAVVGPSGSGKSSLARAGIAATLRRQSRRVITITPGRRPLDAIAECLADPRRPVLVVDQGEELFSLCEDAGIQEEFIAALVRYAETAPVVVVLRADRMGDVAGHPDFARLVEKGLFLLGAMSEPNLRAAIEEPARQAGLIVEPGLVDLLVREVEGEPGALPMLSHTLRETWLRREGRNLTVSGYQASGGVRGAIAKSAEELYGSIAPGERHRMRELMLRLVAPGVEGEPVRTRLPRRAVVADASQDELVDRLIASRLITSDDGVVELAHEALARAWPRLRGWLDDDVDGQRLLHHLTATADAWDSLGRPDSELYRGVRLTQVLDWRSASSPELTAVERDFLHACEAAAETEQRDTEERARQQSRMIRRLRLTLGGAAVLLTLALVAGFLAVGQAQRADDAAVASDAAATAALAREVGAKALVERDLSRAPLLAAAGVILDDSPQTEASLLGVIGQHPELVRSIPIEGANIQSVAVSPDGGRIATYDEDHRVALYARKSGGLLEDYQAGSPRTEQNETGQVEFSPDGKTLAVSMTSLEGRPVTLLDAHSLEPLAAQPAGLPPARWELIDLAFSKDGTHLAATLRRVTGAAATLGASASVAAVWDLTRLPAPEVLPISNDVSNEVSPVGLSPDGRTLYTYSPLTVDDLERGTHRVLRVPHFIGHGGMSVSPDGHSVALGEGEDGSGGVVIVDSRSGAIRQRLDGGGEMQTLRWSRDGRTLVTVTWNFRDVKVWNAKTGEPKTELTLNRGNDTAVGLDRRGDSLYSAGADDSIRVWDLDGRRQFIGRLPFHNKSQQAGFANVSPGGTYVALGGKGWFLDTRTGKVNTPRELPGFAFGAGSWSPDGSRYVTTTGGVLRVWTPAAARVVARAKPVGSRVTEVDHSTDGSRLAVTEQNGTVTLLDAANLTPVGTPVRLDQSVCCVSLGPDNRTAVVLVGNIDPSGYWFDLPHRWALVDLEAGKVLDKGELGFGALWLDYSPDGAHAAVSGWDGELTVVDLRRGDLVRPPVSAHESGVFIFKYSADGSRILTSGTDGAVGLWDAKAGQLISKVFVPGRRFVSAEFKRDGHTVLISDWSGIQAWTWDTRIGPALAFACRAAGRDLTQQEWTDSFGDRPYRPTCSDA